MNKALLILVLMLPLITSSVFAAKYVVAQDVGGLDLVYPEIDYLKQSSPYRFSTRVYNWTNGFLSSTSTNCTFSLYNSTGEYLLFVPMTYDSSYGEWYYNVNINNLSVNDYYSYIIQCNTSNDGGLVSGNFEVTSTGRSVESLDNSGGLAVMLFLLFITSILLWAGVSDRDLTSQDISNFVLKRSALIIAVFLMSLNTAIISSIAVKANLGITSELLTYVWLFGWGGYLLIIYLMFVTMIKVIRMWNVKKRERITGVVE